MDQERTNLKGCEKDANVCQLSSDWSVRGKKIKSPGKHRSDCTFRLADAAGALAALAVLRLSPTPTDSEQPQAAGALAAQAVHRLSPPVGKKKIVPCPATVLVGPCVGRVEREPSRLLSFSRSPKLDLARQTVGIEWVGRSRLALLGLGFYNRPIWPPSLWGGGCPSRLRQPGTALIVSRCASPHEPNEKIMYFVKVIPKGSSKW